MGQDALCCRLDQATKAVRSGAASDVFSNVSKLRVAANCDLARCCELALHTIEAIGSPPPSTSTELDRSSTTAEETTTDLVLNILVRGIVKLAACQATAVAAAAATASSDLDPGEDGAQERFCADAAVHLLNAIGDMTTCPDITTVLLGAPDVVPLARLQAKPIVRHHIIWVLANTACDHPKNKVLIDTTFNMLTDGVALWDHLDNEHRGTLVWALSALMQVPIDQYPVCALASLVQDSVHWLESFPMETPVVAALVRRLLKQNSEQTLAVLTPSSDLWHLFLTDTTKECSTSYRVWRDAVKADSSFPLSNDVVLALTSCLRSSSKNQAMLVEAVRTLVVKDEANTDKVLPSVKKIVEAALADMQSGSQSLSDAVYYLVIDALDIFRLSLQSQHSHVMEHALEHQLVSLIIQALDPSPWQSCPKELREMWLEAAEPSLKLLKQLAKNVFQRQILVRHSMRVLCMLVESCSSLQQLALKLISALDCQNPTTAMQFVMEGGIYVLCLCRASEDTKSKIQNIATEILDAVRSAYFGRESFRDQLRSVLYLSHSALAGSSTLRVNVMMALSWLHRFTSEEAERDSEDEELLQELRKQLAAVPKSSLMSVHAKYALDLLHPEEAL